MRGHAWHAADLSSSLKVWGDSFQRPSLPAGGPQLPPARRIFVVHHPACLITQDSEACFALSSRIYSSCRAWPHDAWAAPHGLPCPCAVYVQEFDFSRMRTTHQMINCAAQCRLQPRPRGSLTRTRHAAASSGPSCCSLCKGASTQPAEQRALGTALNDALSRMQKWTVKSSRLPARTSCCL